MTKRNISEDYRKRASEKSKNNTNVKGYKWYHNNQGELKRSPTPLGPEWTPGTGRKRRIND